MPKSSADVEREVEDARGQIDRTVEALKDKMQPKELFDEATRIMGGASNKALTTVVEQARQNPIPLALIGAGIAWLAISQTRRRSGDEIYSSSGHYPVYEGYDEESGAGRRIKAQVSGAVETAREKLSAAVDQAKEGLGAARTGAMEGAAQARGRAGALANAAQARAADAGREAKRRFDDTLETEPLIIGALGLAVGVAIGAALPSTPVERRYIGPTRDKVVGRSRDMAKTSLGEVKDVAQRAYGQVKDELHRQTGPAGEGASLVEKAQAIAEAGTQAVREDLDSRLPH